MGPGECATVQISALPPGRRVPSLATLMSNSRWTFTDSPFRHIRVENVFIDAAYRQIVAAFRETLPRKDTDQPDGSRMVYHQGTFGAFLLPFKPSLAGPLSLFISKAWVDLLQKATGVQATLDVNGALHYHPAGGKDGFIHKDFSSCWFVPQPRPDGVNVADNAICNYRTGETSVPGLQSAERIRAVAMLYYLNNAPWSFGDGGGTGLYRCVDDSIHDPAAAVPPINNTMLIFECSPHSNHSFISNRNPRSSIVMWLHRTKPETIARWGEESILYVKGY